MNIEGETTEDTETVVVEEQAPKAKAKRSRAKKEVQKDTPSERAKRSSKKAAFDHSDFTEEEKKARGIETEEEKEIRVAKQDEEKKNAPKASKKKAKKGAAKAKPKAAAKAKKAKAETKPKKVKAKAKPSDKGLTKAGEPRQKSEFDPDTTLGQRGAKIKLEKDELNDNEKEVLTAIRQARGPVKLTALADKCFAVNLGSKKRNSRVRNALRRLIRASFVKKTGRGEFEAKVAKKAA